MRGIAWEYLHIAIDDHTRLAYAAIFPDETAASAMAFLALARAWFAEQGVTIERLLTDNGSAYRARLFAAVCRRWAIGHRWTRPYTPRTNGKAERFIRTCLQEWAYARAYRSSRARASALDNFLRYYNHHRMHMGIHGQTPYQRLTRYRNQ